MITDHELLAWGEGYRLEQKLTKTGVPFFIEKNGKEYAQITVQKQGLHWFRYDAEQIECFVTFADLFRIMETGLEK